jgi:hypothetical protein
MAAQAPGTAVEDLLVVSAVEATPRSRNGSGMPRYTLSTTWAIGPAAALHACTLILCVAKDETLLLLVLLLLLLPLRLLPLLLLRLRLLLLLLLLWHHSHGVLWMAHALLEWRSAMVLLLHHMLWLLRLLRGTSINDGRENVMANVFTC